MMGTVVIGKDDGRYPDVQWGANARWVGTPDRVCLPETPAEVVATLQETVHRGERVAVRSGGHCYEAFVNSAEIGTVIDLRRLVGVEIDEQTKSFAVGSGMTLGNLYSELYLRWGVTLPGGSCPTVGVGGHVAGGGFGPLSRAFGLTVDHLEAVEVAVVNADSSVELLRAHRDPQCSNHELWWAHTGGGGGNFGIVTRYFFASSDRDADPRSWLPSPPSQTYLSTIGWAWPTVDAATFATLMTNFATFFADHAGPGTEFAQQFSQLNLAHASAGGFAVTTLRDGTSVDARELCVAFENFMQQDTRVEALVMDRRTVPWLHLATQWHGLAASDTTTAFKGKSAYLRRPMKEVSVQAFYRHLTREGFMNPTCGAMVMSHGGAVNAVQDSETAVCQRDSIAKINYNTFWVNDSDADMNLNWIREFYREVHEDAGGVPAPGEHYDGSFINYADVDLMNPRWNTSGVAWHDLYYGKNYRRLQHVKADYDPTSFFHHAMSIVPIK